MRLDIARALKTRLVEKGCPVQNIVLDESTDTVTGARERIVLERNLEGSDGFGSPRGQHGNPKHVFTRTVPLKLTIYAQSGKSGALSFEHEERTDNLVETVLSCLDVVLRADLQVIWQPTGGRFVPPADLVDSAKLPGHVYELMFTVDRAVRAVTWAKAAKPEITAGADLFANTTQVGLANGPEGAPVVTGCGGDG